MPNTPVPAAATGLPSIQPSLQHIMLQAHDYACDMPARLPYADRFREALRRAWRDTRAAMTRRLRSMVEDRIERLVAFLDALDGDENLEPSLGFYEASKYEVDAEHDSADDEPSLGASKTGDGYQTHWCQGGAEDLEDAAEATARRKELYEALHPETINGALGRGHTKVRQSGEPSDADRFSKATAVATGQSERTVQRDALHALQEEAEAARETSARLGAIIARLSNLPCATASRT